VALAENLEAAGAAIVAVRALNYKSNNRGAALDGLSAELSDTRGKFANTMFDATYADLLSRVPRDEEEPRGLASFVAPAAVARRMQFGNCEARAGLALIWLGKHRAVRPLELFGYGDHAFVVIGRTRGRANAPAEWNAEAVVCDPWAEAHYAASQLNQHLAAPPVSDVAGADARLTQSFEHNGAGWPPADLSHYLDETGLSDLWP
jgi:hypothetical protein